MGLVAALLLNGKAADIKQAPAMMPEVIFLNILIWGI